MLTKKSALITGSLGGIGFATARALAGLGCDITLNGLGAPEVVEARLTELHASGAGAISRRRFAAARTDRGPDRDHPAGA